MGHHLEEYGSRIFGFKNMQKYLAKETFVALKETMQKGGMLDHNIAEHVAEGMKKWAIDHNATHFCHWFQPLTGKTAEKHMAFLSTQQDDGVILQFSGKDLIQGEADASSLPSGGLRKTSQARGYTAWDPTSFAFIRKGITGAVLCIPTMFCGYHGEVLDRKIPLIRSKNALIKQLVRLAKLLNIEQKITPYITVGGEQEYFLIDRKYYCQRMDLMQTGRTLFGIVPPKHQQLEDHYFGVINRKILAFMEEVDNELWQLGIPAKIRHNEVAPAQFEIVPVFEELNLAVDHNMLIMEMLSTVAEKHDLACLLHEKPFAGINGSGKHNNWSLVGTDKKNWLSYENNKDKERFLTLICAIMQAIDEYSGLLRASVASFGNDHRLGANEAPPAIISIFLGEHLCDIVEHIGVSGKLPLEKMDVTSEHDLPILCRDVTDRNRTAPFAFTGNKFEFRSIGASMNMAEANTVLNTIVAASLDDICSELEKGKKLAAVLQNIVKKHKRILFNGNNYSNEWKEDAKRRGLLNLTTTPQALLEMKTQKCLDLFVKYAVFSKQEALSQYEVAIHNYWTKVDVEIKCAIFMIRSLIVPAVLKYQNELSQMTKEVKAQKVVKNLLKTISFAIRGISSCLENIEKGKRDSYLDELLKLRGFVDLLEENMPKSNWPQVSYADMLFRF